MSTLYEKPLQFKLEARRSYQLWYVMLYFVALLVILVATGLPALIKLILTLSLLYTLHWQWKKLVLLPGMLRQIEGTDWILEDQQGEVVCAKLTPIGFISTGLIIVIFKLTDDRYRSLVILPYMMDKDKFRQISAYLRMIDQKIFRDE